MQGFPATESTCGCVSGPELLGGAGKGSEGRLSEPFVCPGLARCGRVRGMTETTTCRFGTCTPGPDLRCTSCGRLPLFAVTTTPPAGTPAGEGGRGPKPPESPTRARVPASPEAKVQLTRDLADLAKEPGQLQVVIGPRRHEEDEQGALVPGGAGLPWQPINLQEQRARRREDGGAAGPAFQFELFGSGPDGETAMGYIEHPTHPITVMTSMEDLRGLAFTVEDAEKVGRELLDTVATWKACGGKLRDEVFTRREVTLTAQVRLSDGEMARAEFTVDASKLQDRDVRAVLGGLEAPLRALAQGVVVEAGARAVDASGGQQEGRFVEDAMAWLRAGDGARMDGWPEHHVLRLLTGEALATSWEALGGTGSAPSSALVLFEGEATGDAALPVVGTMTLWEPYSTVVLRERWRRVRTR